MGLEWNCIGVCRVMMPFKERTVNITTAIRTPQTIPCPEATDLDPDYHPCAKTNRRAVFLITILGSSLAFIDGSIVNVALPTLQRVFHAGASSVQLVVQSYALFSGALLLLSGALGDQFGRKKIFVLGAALFTTSSLGCAVANSLSFLIVCRTLQGIGASLLIPQSLAILSAAYPAEDRAAAIGTWSAWTSVFAALGPVAGGWLIQSLNWRWAFAINLPVAIWIFSLLPKLRESESDFSLESLRKLDLRGTLLNTLGLGAVVYSLSFASKYGWDSLQITGTFVLGLLLIVAFLVTQSRQENALMPLSLFTNQRFLSVNILTFLLYGALAVAFYLVPFFAIQIKHLDAVGTGAAFLPCIAVVFVFASRIGRMSARFGERPFLIIGAIASAVGMALFAIFARQPGYATSLLPGMVGLGVGLTIVLAPLTNVVMTSVPDGKSSLASAVNNSVSRLAGLLVLSGLILVLSHAFDHSLAHKLSSSSLPSNAKDSLYAGRSLMAAVEIPNALKGKERETAAAILADSYTDGYELVMYCCAVAALLSALPVIFWWRRSVEKAPVIEIRAVNLGQKRQQLA
jgi:EmrB/QacA subfamily drug resistance transporter